MMMSKPPRMVCTIRRTVTTTSHVKPLIERTLVDGREESSAVVEEVLVGTEVEEDVLQLPPGVSQPEGDGLETQTSVQDSEEVLEDGSFVRTTVKTTIVTVIKVSEPPSDLSQGPKDAVEITEELPRPHYCLL